MNETEKDMAAEYAKLQSYFELLQKAICRDRDMVFVKDPQLIYVAVSDSFARMAGKTADEIIGCTDYEVFSDPTLAERYRTDDGSLLSSGRNLYGIIEPLPDLQGKPQYASTNKELLTDSAGKTLGIMGVSRDLGPLRSAQQHFYTELKHLLTLSEEDYYALAADVDEWRILDCRISPRCPLRISGNPDLNDIADNARRQVTAETQEAYQFYQNFSADYLRQLYQSGHSQVVMEYLHETEEGTRNWMQDRVILRTNPENGHLYVILTLHSVEKERRKVLTLQHEAETDGLTGLMNRQCFIRKCKEFLEQNGDREHAFFMIDVDYFKKINDTYGHRTGDDFLVTLASLLRSSLRSDDLIGRLGGDEFVILMKNIPGLDLVQQRASQILQKTRSTVQQYPDVQPSVSIGISRFPQDGTSVEALYGNADIALYKAKRTRNNCCEFYAEEI